MVVWGGVGTTAPVCSVAMGAEDDDDDERSCNGRKGPTASSFCFFPTTHAVAPSEHSGEDTEATVVGISVGMEEEKAVVVQRRSGTVEGSSGLADVPGVGMRLVPFGSPSGRGHEATHGLVERTSEVVVCSPFLAFHEGGAGDDCWGGG